MPWSHDDVSTHSRFPAVRGRGFVGLSAIVLPVLLIAGVLALMPAARATWYSPMAAFVSIVTLTSLCVVGASVVLAIGWRHRLAELAMLGSALAVASVLPLAHGLTVPGVLYGDNAAVMVTAFIALPLALLAAAPLLAPKSAFSRIVVPHWRSWTVATLTLGVVSAGLLLAIPNLLPSPQAGSPIALAVVGASIAGTLVLAGRNVRLYRIGRRPASLAAAGGLMYLGLSSLVWLGAGPYSLAWWLAHALDAAGVLAAVAGLIVAHHKDGSLVPVFQPVLNRDPLIALELGLAPVVHRFVAALEQKDRVTREHVIRVAELALRAGQTAGLSGTRLRSLGIGALLHDIGKLNTPDEILTKPGALTDDEFAIMKRHTEWGAALLAPWPALTDAAPLVRWHHERADGRGYPDGIDQTTLPLEAALISVCDAFDAMTSDRPYRKGMDPHDACAILDDGRGTQWTSDAIDYVRREIERNGPVTQPAFATIGVDEATAADLAGHDLVCVCLDALPEAVRV